MKKTEVRQIIREEIARLNESHPALKSLKDILKYLKDEYGHPKLVYTDVKFKEVPEPGNPSNKIWQLDVKADGRPYRDFFSFDKSKGVFIHRD